MKVTKKKSKAKREAYLSTKILAKETSTPREPRKRSVQLVLLQYFFISEVGECYTARSRKNLLLTVPKRKASN